MFRSPPSFECFKSLQNLSPHFSTFPLPAGIQFIDAHCRVEERGVSMFSLHGESAGPKLLVAGKGQLRLGLADQSILSHLTQEKELSY